MKELAKLKESEEKYRESINLANDAIFSLNINTAQIIDSNKKAETISGYPKAELCKLKIWDLYPVQDENRLEELWRQVKEEGSGILYDVNHRKMDGSITPTSISASVIGYGNKKLIQYICSDISERKKREEKLLESEEHKRQLLNSLKEGIYQCEPGIEGKFTWINKAGAEMLGYKSPEEVIGAKVKNIYMNPDDRRRLVEKLEKDGIWRNFESLCKKKDGESFYAERTANVIKNEKGEIVRLEGILRDITELKKLEQQLVRSERFAAIGELAAEVAHEINNPLGGLQNFTRMIEREPDNIQQTKEFIELIQEGLDRIEVIVKRLTTFTTPHVLKKSDKDLNEIIESSLVFMMHRLENVKISIQKKLALRLPGIYVDRDSISQVVINLLSNAIDSMPDGGKLMIETRLCNEHDSCVQFSISDTGPGINKEEMNKIFDPFFTTKDKGKGIGIGLAISKRIIEDHGGEIRVEMSTAAEETTFTVCLPLRNNKDML
ncbi:PAS domain S-box protein [Candidatus Scalindua japonica]|nr:PAS domain S-box protein [Candidatus Scalindua japonica]